MKMRWIGDELHISDEDDERGSYVGRTWAVNATDPDSKYRAVFLELEASPLLQDMEEQRFKSKRSAKIAMRKAFMLAWIGATEEEREDSWDSWK